MDGLAAGLRLKHVAEGVVDVHRVVVVGAAAARVHTDAVGLAVIGRGGAVARVRGRRWGRRRRGSAFVVIEAAVVSRTAVDPLRLTPAAGRRAAMSSNLLATPE